MFLSDRDIKLRLAEFSFESENEAYAFDVEDQVGPCSVDLRLSAAYWRLRPKWRRGRRPIRIGRISLEELSPRRQWERQVLRDSQTLRLKPREMVIARTAESFNIPTDCAGFVQGRSSYARLGLSVHPSAGFINPGWAGRFPLPLMNESDAVIEIPRGTAICQVLIIPLGEKPEQDYVARGSKYQNDDGGPSYWWRDRLLSELVKRHPGTIADNLVQDLAELVKEGSEDLVHALDDYLDDAPAGDFADASAFIEDFGRYESNRGRRRGALELLLGGGSASLLVAGILSDFPLPMLPYVGAAVVAGFAAAELRLVRRQYFTPKVLQRMQLADVDNAPAGDG